LTERCSSAQRGRLNSKHQWLHQAVSYPRHRAPEAGAGPGSGGAAGDRLTCPTPSATSVRRHGSRAPGHCLSATGAVCSGSRREIGFTPGVAAGLLALAELAAADGDRTRRGRCSLSQQPPPLPGRRSRGLRWIDQSASVTHAPTNYEHSVMPGSLGRHSIRSLRVGQWRGIPLLIGLLGPGAPYRADIYPPPGDVHG